MRIVRLIFYLELEGSAHQPLAISFKPTNAEVILPWHYILVVILLHARSWHANLLVVLEIEPNKSCRCWFVSLINHSASELCISNNITINECTVIRLSCASVWVDTCMVDVYIKILSCLLLCKYSRTFTNSRLSTTAISHYNGHLFVLVDGPHPHTFTIILTSLQQPPLHDGNGH